MILKVTMKSPDCLDFAIDEALSSLDAESDEKAELNEEYEELCKRWFKYGEYCTILIDTEKKTATVEEIHGQG